LSRGLERLSTRIFTVSEGSKQFLVDHIGLRAVRIGVIPNGVDTVRFHPAGRTAPGEELVVGTLGSLTAVKNQALLIRACHALMQRGVRLRLEIAGEGPERPALERLVRSLGMADRISLRGHVSDTPAFLNTLDVFVLPSDSEAHPNALSEAAACGLPCIASRVGGIPEITDQGRAALLFNRGDEDGLVELLGKLAADPDRRRALGGLALSFIARNYSMASMLARYRSLYQEPGGRISEAGGHFD
jgi:glycosyltransferase involved in cell wall biosynthesis